MSVESVSLAFVAEKAGRGGEAVVVAVLMLAAEWLDVRINVLAVITCYKLLVRTLGLTHS